MTTLLAHLKIRSDRTGEFEDIARDLARQTTANEEGCLRYEYWRGAAPDTYYVLLSFVDSAAFYLHQASDWHEGYTPALRECWETITLEIVDPVPGAGPLPSTRPIPLPDDAPELQRVHEKAVPIVRQAWWGD